MNKTGVAKSAILFSFILLAAACGNGGETKPATTSDSPAATTTPPATTPAAGVPGEKGLELIGASDCTTCHRLHQSGDGPAIGPAYDQVAAKYSPAADTTIDRG